MSESTEGVVGHVGDMTPKIHIYLDDERPTPRGWVRAYTRDGMISLLQQTPVESVGVISLDHDLGMCTECTELYNQRRFGELASLLPDNPGGYYTCVHNGTGYEVGLWMEANGYLPETPPRVHSMNPVGKARMQAGIKSMYRKVR
jgi:hypothetical protein